MNIRSKVLLTILIAGVCQLFLVDYIFASEESERMALYKKTSAVTDIPWYYFAAIDQYERQINDDPSEGRVTAIQPDPLFWNGIDYPSMFFPSGWGTSGNGDKKIDITNDEDILWSLGNYIKSYGTTKDDIRIALWNYYKRDLTVQTIMNTAKVFKKFQTVSLKDRDFPLPLEANFSYNNTWGDARGFGGRRIHEGTDIFANHGVPVKSTTYGVVEMKGWNEYGGWRIGIRDIFNIYHYYAHLNGFKDGMNVGDVVKPGDVIGSVGATGYGPPGTSGKFPPHLHYGMYQDNGENEWSFDPYPYLKRWEKLARE
ncbi:M23 family metallopeptidase [Halobacillus shinanisalinarum]|uniref:M23 family metallopeptidase n=1 Tax=Halobacillus shinanisalinarum TaxID=2932258 RepID=A0ABY4H1U3_9BACI|nr:M23 family metallopeptidase [Halobacillus shinanisalinarum]UOQ94246.1 M23 family metallopeptidase [Halobacillus shinanisalinarum]